MNNKKLLHTFKINPIWLVFIVSLSFTATSQQTTKQIQELISADPIKGLEQAKQFWQGKEIKSENLKAGLLMISAYIKNKKYNLANDLLNQFLLLETLKTSDKGLLLAKKLNYIRNSKTTKDYTTTYEQIKLIIKKLIQSPNQKYRDLALYELNSEMGFKHYYAAEFEASEPYFLQSLKYIDKSDKKSVSSLLNIIGVVYAQQAKLSTSAQYMLDSIKLLEDNNIPISAGRYKNLGSLYFGLKEYDKTIQYSQKAMAMNPEPSKLTASLYSNMAAAQIEQGLFKEAIENLLHSIKISTDIGSSSAKARNNLGYVYTQTGQYKQALEQLNMSAQQLDDVDNFELSAVSFKSRADVYAAMKDYDQALKFYNKALEIFTKKDLKLKRVELYPKMIKVLEIKKDYKRAFQVLQEYKILNDELTEVESTKQVNQILSKFELEKKEQELANSEIVRDKQLKEITLLNHKYTLEHKIRKLMFVLLAALATMLFLIYRSWRLRGKINKVLLDKNNRIENQHNELSILNLELKKQTEIDSLTGLKNRRFITEMIAREIAKEKNNQRKWCLMIIDVDDFKSVNDIYGHQKGDEVLIQFAHCLNKNMGKHDVVARWGGEEFLWISEIKGSNDGAYLCDTFQSTLSMQSWFKDKKKKLSCSIGFSTFPLIELSFKDWESALRLADYALYQAKNSGKDCWTGFEIIDHKLDYDEINDVENLVKGNRLKVLKKQALD